MSRAGAHADREPHDAYYTPPWAVRAFLPHILPTLPSRARVLEPACGHGAILSGLSAWGVAPRDLAGLDIDPEAVDVCRGLGFNVACADFLSLSPLRRFDLIIGNPPFLRAEDFVRKALTLVRTMGKVAFLLRLNFLEGQRRHAWMRSNVPDVYVLPRRPSFYASGPKRGKTDGTAYAWAVFYDEPRFVGSVRILDLADCADDPTPPA